MDPSIFPWVYPAAFVLDHLLGDPPGLPHPVRGIGRAALFLERFFRRRIPSEAWAGLFFWLSIAGGTFGAGLGLLALSDFGGPWVRAGAGVLMIYYCVAIRDMHRHARKVQRALRAGDLAQAREAVGRIVGRDVDGIDEAGVARAAVESVAESLTDGVVAPLFYAFLGGPALALFYRAANTLDSMVGYRTKRYAAFGRASARADDFLNYIPARISLALVALAAPLCSRSGPRALAAGIRDGRKSESPNAGLPQAAFAGALGIRLGGPAAYGGEAVEKPWFGEEGREVEAADIGRALALFHVSAFFLLAAGVAVLFFAGYDPIGL